jgi:hypothetical protein
MLAPKTTGLTREMRGRIADEERALVETSSSRNSAGYLSYLLEFHEQLIEEGAETLYTAYCEVCEMQNRSVSPNFVRAIRDGPIAQFIAARRSTVISEAGLQGMRVNDPPNPYALSEFSRKIDRFIVSWNLKLESDAAAIEYRVIKSRSARSEAVNLSAKDIATSADALARDTRREVVIRKVQNPQANTILSFDEAAIYFEVQPRTIHRWRDQGD